MHASVALAQSTLSEPGHRGGFAYVESKLTPAELELLHRAAEDAATRYAREMGSPAAKTRAELAADVEKLREMLKLTIKKIRLDGRKRP